MARERPGSSHARNDQQPEGQPPRPDGTERGGTDRPAPDGGAASRFALSLADLEKSAHIPLADQVIAIRSSEPGRSPGEDDLAREQRSVINPGL
jgi:hypothetical protein